MKSHSEGEAMPRIFIFALITTLLLTNCQKKEEEAPRENIAAGVVSNLSTISASYTPTSLDSANASGVVIKSDPCAGVTDFAVCQSNLIREYLQIGKNVVDTLSQLANSIGSALGKLDDGSTGTSNDGKISWNKSSSTVWSILTYGTGGNSVAYFSVNGGVYTLKMNANNDESDPKDQLLEATVTFNSADDWSVDVFFSNSVCDTGDVGSPSKAHIKLTKSSGLWAGKAMLYVPRWASPGTTLTCATAAGLPGSEITLYTDFVGNDTSTKAALYLIPATENTAGIPAIASYDLPDFCTNFASSCGGMGEPTAGALAAYPNNWCTTGAGTSPTWGDNCNTNAPVNAASFSSAALWTTPADLKVKSVTLPPSL